MQLQLLAKSLPILFLSTILRADSIMLGSLSFVHSTSYYKQKIVQTSQSYHSYREIKYILLTIVIKLNMKQLRQTILADAQLVASRKRFGLFSQPPPLGLGDDSQYRPKHANKGEDGKPRTSPRNMLAGPNRTGVDKKAFLQTPDSIYRNDPYKDQLSVQLQYYNKMHSKSSMHQSDFVPASGTKTVANFPYPYVEQKQNPQKKVQKDPNGRVKTQPANFLTNPTSKVDAKIFKPAPHMRDEYSRPQQVEKQQKQLWKSKIIHEAMFKSMSHGDSNFTKDKIQYGIDDKAKSLIEKKKSHNYGNYHRYNHENKFKLARKGHGDPIGRYPQYVKPRERALTEATEGTRLKTEKSDTQKELWKPSSGVLSRPTPSISLMPKNIRRCF